MKYILIIFWLIVLFLAMTPPGEIDWSFPWWWWIAVVVFLVLFVIAGFMAYDYPKYKKERDQLLKKLEER